MTGKQIIAWLKRLAVLALFLTGCQNPPQDSSNTPSAEAETGKKKDTESIVILHTNDVHCGLTDRIGYDGLALYRKEMEQEYEHVLLVDAGDAIQGGVYGSLSQGDVIIQLMNALGYDCATLGNHEFDYGFEILDDLSEKLNCGYICANFCTADGQPVFEPYRIFERAGRKIAFIGIDTPTTFTKSPIHSITDDQGIPMYDFLADETGDRLAECIQKNVNEVREKGADIVILLAHLGNGAGDDPRYHSEEIMARTTGIDLLIDGHEHAVRCEEMKNRDGKPVPTSQTGTKLEAIGKVIIRPDRTIETELVEEIPAPEGIEGELVSRGKKERWVDPAMRKKISELTAVYEEMLNSRIGETACEIPLEDWDENADTQDFGLGDLLADAMRELSGADLSLVVSASLRSGLNQGDILLSDMVNLLPYGNDVLVISIRGADLLDALEFGVRTLPLPNNGLLQVSGIEYTVDLSVPSSTQEDANGVFLGVEGERRIKEVLIDGQPLDTEKMYSAAVTDYLFLGGEGMTMLGNGELKQYVQMSDRAMLARYITENLGGRVPEVYARSQGRIRILNH